MIQQISSATSDPTLCDSILPRASKGCSDSLWSDGRYSSADYVSELSVAIMNQISGALVVRKCFPQLLRDPESGWMSSGVAVQDSSSVMRNDKEAIEHTEGDRWDGEEIHRCDGFTVILRESLPASCRFRVLRSSPPNEKQFAQRYQS